jgi:hypothetical protein
MKAYYQVFTNEILHSSHTDKADAIRTKKNILSDCCKWSKQRKAWVEVQSLQPKVTIVLKQEA